MMTTTLKGTTVALGIGLAILWIAGLSSPYSPGWLTWLDGVAALAAFTIAGSLRNDDSRARRMGMEIGLSVALFAMGIVGLATGAIGWLSWWTFAFACAFLILGVASASRPTLIREQREEQAFFDEEPMSSERDRQHEIDKKMQEERDRFKKTG